MARQTKETNDTTKNLESLGLRNARGDMFVVGEHFQKIYANNVQMSMSIFDMSLAFGEIIGQTETGQPIVEQKVKINMSKEFFKAMQNLIVKNMDEFERVYGEVKILTASEFLPNLGEETTQTKRPARKRKQS